MRSFLIGSLVWLAAGNGRLAWFTTGGGSASFAILSVPILRILRWKIAKNAYTEAFRSFRSFFQVAQLRDPSCSAHMEIAFGSFGSFGAYPLLRLIPP
jgi:hypothetical protein